jgi:DNA invertase Pin-like site-specific DNA recombinase
MTLHRPHVLVAAFDRIARSVRHFLAVVDELTHLNIEFISFERMSITAARWAGP